MPQLLPEAVRGSVPRTEFHINAGAPGAWVVTINSAVWAALTPGLTIEFLQEMRPTGEPWRGAGSTIYTSGNTTKDGTGLPRFLVQWDGREMDYAVTITVNAAHAWGLSAEVQ